MNRQIATFYLGDTLLGLDILLIKEVYRNMIYTAIPGAPRELRGLMNLRGRVVTIVDLYVCLSRKEKENIESCKLLILKTDPEIAKYQNAGQLGEYRLGEDIVGLLIDKMDDVIMIDNKEIIPPPPNIEYVEEELIEGIVKKDDRLIILINLTALLERIVSITSAAKEK